VELCITSLGIYASTTVSCGIGHVSQIPKPGYKNMGLTVCPLSGTGLNQTVNFYFIIATTKHFSTVPLSPAVRFRFTCPDRTVKTKIIKLILSAYNLIRININCLLLKQNKTLTPKQPPTWN